jgi:maltooligosyltrehalose trehalohydrolase
MTRLVIEPLAIADPKKMRAAMTALLLSPSIPFLFMGEEWQSHTPFKFFCDFEPELSRAVTEGRRREFSHSPEFSNPENKDRIPDPCHHSTFEASKLNWNELHGAPFADALSFTRNLLATRQATIVPLLSLLRKAKTSASKEYKPSILHQQGNAVVVAWPLPQCGNLILGLNLGEEFIAIESSTKIKALSFEQLRDNDMIFESDDHVFKSFRQGQLLPCSAVYLKVPS